MTIVTGVKPPQMAVYLSDVYNPVMNVLIPPIFAGEPLSFKQGLAVWGILFLLPLAAVVLITSLVIKKRIPWKVIIAIVVLWILSFFLI